MSAEKERPEGRIWCYVVKVLHDEAIFAEQINHW